MSMMFLKTVTNWPAWTRGILLGAGALALTACAEVDNTAGSKLSQPAVDANGQPIIDAGDIAIAGQEFAHSVMDLPEVSGASVPPLVRFSGVTSIVNGPVDTSPYTGLLRDRLLLITREKLRFVERELPPLRPHKIKSNKDLPPPVMVDTNADYQVVAELRGTFDEDFYRIQIQFLDLHSNQVLFNGLYRIRKEVSQEPEPTPVYNNGQPIESTAPQGPVTPVDLNTAPRGGTTIQ